VGTGGTAEELGFGVPITGSIDQITETVAGFRDVGVTRVEIMPWPPTLDSVEQLEPLFAHLK